MRGREVVELIRLGPPDRFGQRLDMPPLEIVGCVIWPRTSSEGAGRGAAEDISARGVLTIAGLNIFMPPGNEVLASDRIRARGEVYEVEGETGDYRNTSGREIGLIVTLRKVGIPVAI